MKFAKGKGPGTIKGKKPRQQRLPGTEDPKIVELHGAAEDYVEVRDERMQLTQQESERSEALLKLMKKHGKTVYRCEGIEIRIVHEDEKVKVKKAKKDKDE